jgi:5-methylcytosine-specific restriction endonuclease McrA
MIPKPKPKRKSNRNPTPQELLDQVYERDDGICQYCGVYCGNQIPHHIVPAGIGGKRIHRIENLITLCLDCHREAHTSKDMREWAYEWSRKRYGNTIDKLLESKWSGEK